MIFFVLLNQVLVLFLLMGVGYALAKTGMISSSCSSQITRLLCYMISPCLTVHAFQMKFSGGLFKSYLIMSAAVVGIHLVNIAVGHAIFNKKTVPDTYKRSVMRFSSVYSNSGFMGFPLLQALAGANGLFYGTAYNGVLNLFIWTHGLLLYTGKADKKSILKAAVNPNIIAVLVGVLIFRFSIVLPAPVSSTIKYIGDLNTPLSMIIIGTMIAQIPIRKIFSGFLLWAGVAVRNLLLPFLLLFLLHAVGIKGQMLLCCMIPAACPVAGSTVIFANLTGKDETFPCKIMTLSTVLNLVTVPAVITAMSILKF